MSVFHDKGFFTKAVHGGEPREMSATPIYQNVTFQGVYYRRTNPTVEVLEKKMAILENGEDAIATASGMAAITQTLLTLLKNGDHIVAHKCLYVGTYRFIRDYLPKFGINVSFIDFRDLSLLENVLRKKKTKIVYFEPISNPLLEVIDVKAVIDLAHEYEAAVIVDNTFTTPYLIQPLSLGADIVVHSATKYLSGHGDTIGGVIVGSKEVTEKIREGRKIFGGVISPLNAFLIIRGIKTLPLRMEKHCSNAQKIAEFLAGHPKIVSVRYPGLALHPNHFVAARQFKCFGGMIGVEITGGTKKIEEFTSQLRICKPYTSLGDVSTLLTWYEQDENRGIPDGYIRISVGIEDAEDIISDLDQALKAI